MVVAALRRPRGFIEIEVMSALALVMAIAIAVVAACAVGGHVLSERDRALATAADAEERADRCATSLAAVVVAADNLQRAIDLHLAIDDDACACWQAEQP